ncbi:unnamed protein product [Effrenium voratum]|nr:unnamed protein product [Effrenium voratum]
MACIQPVFSIHGCWAHAPEQVATHEARRSRAPPTLERAGRPVLEKGASPKPSLIARLELAISQARPCPQKSSGDANAHKQPKAYQFMLKFFNLFRWTTDMSGLDEREIGD